MRYALDLGQLYGQVWVTFRVACPVPARLTADGHAARSLAVRYTKPVIRSWLGVGSPTPPPSLSGHSLDTNLTSNG